MDSDNEQFMFDMLDAFDNMAEKKFRAGQKEHGGHIANLSNSRLLDEAIAETIDQFVYLYTLKRNLNK